MLLETTPCAMVSLVGEEWKTLFVRCDGGTASV